MRPLLVLLLVLALLPSALAAQARVLSGRVTSSAGQPLAGVRVEERGTQNVALTNAEGRYVLRAVAPDAVIRFRMFGYEEQEQRPAGAATLDVVLRESAVAMDELVVVGTRRQDRSVLETPAPVDVIDVELVTRQSGQLDLNQLLQYVAPSFNANRQSGADGSDHIDPAALRGLGPDQTLVLINGKRRHQSSLINIFGSRGRGNTGTDLNAIPAAAIERIEILRDGASAQYGSDAIAGVINIVLKSGADGLSGSLAAGVRDASPPDEYDVLRERSFDGEEIQLSGNYGFRLGRDGFVNTTAEFLKKGHTNRPADPNQFDIYRQQFGDAALDNLGFFVNSRLPVGGASGALYAFGGVNLRDSDAYAWTRDADSERNVPEIYPNGFNPVIQSDIRDVSLSTGYATKLGPWSVDLNNTFGSNRFHFSVDRTLNASLGPQSPTHFDAGGFQFSQNTSGLSATQFLPGVAAGLNVAMGAEFRVDNYQIFAGEEGSYRNYKPGSGAPGGSQGFPGFQPSNELNETRTNLGAYLDTELDLSRRFMVAAAARYENYSDFGSTLTGKLASRFSLSEAVTLRGSVSTGFRAPSLAQVYFNTTFTDFVGGQPVEKMIAHNRSPITRALGIPELKEEKATNLGAGLTARMGRFTATVDGYYVDVRDRIVLTGAFEDTDEEIGAELQRLGVSAAQFFTNALDTKTRGLDVVLAFAENFGQHTVRAAVAGNFNEMELGEIHTSPKLQGKEDIYFGKREQYFLLASAPPSKVALSLDHGVGRLQSSVRVNHFGEVVLIDWIDEEDVYRPKATTDLSLTYQVTPRASLTVGGANVFDVYPTQQDTETETGGLWDAVQMGSSGAFYFARLSFRM